MKKIFILSLILILFFTCTSVFASDINQTEMSIEDQSGDIIEIKNQDNNEDIVSSEEGENVVATSIDENFENLSSNDDNEIVSSEEDNILGELSSGDYSVHVPKTIISYQKGGTIDCSIDYYVSRISGQYGAEFYVKIYNSANSQVYSSKVSVPAFGEYASSNVNGYQLNPGDYTIKIINTKDNKNKVSATLTVVDSNENNYNSLRGDIGSVPSGGTLYLDKDYIFEGNLKSQFSILKEITIDGGNHIIDANYSNGIFTIAANNVVLKNIVFKNVYAPTLNGGAIYWSGQYGKLINCTFINNHAQNGGAVYWYSYRAEMSDCKFINNTASSNGGGLSQNHYAVKITNCIFTENTANNGGGASCNGDFDNTIFTGCIFNNNNASNDGGAIYSTEKNGGITISNSDFTNNIASNRGGAVSTIWTKFNDCNFNNNHALIGGALNLDDYVRSTITNSIFNNNVADYGSSINMKRYLCNFNNTSFNGEKKNYNKYLYIENKLSPELTVNVSDINLGETLYMQSSFSQNINGKLTINLINTRVNDIAYSSTTVLDGTIDSVQLSANNLKSGIYILNATYFGDNLFNSTSIITDFEVIGLQSDISFKVNNISWGDSIIITPELTTGATGLIDIYVDDIYIDTMSVGSDYKLTDLGGPFSDITLDYLGDDVYRFCSHTERINVKRINTTMEISEIESGYLSTVNITLNNDATGILTVTFNGRKYSGYLINGTYSFNTTNLKSGTANIKIVYEGDSKYESFELNKPVNITLNSAPIVLNINNILYGDDLIMTPKVSGSLGKFEIYVDNTYKTTINEGNSYTLSDLDLGKHTVRLEYIDDVYYENNEYLTTFAVYKKYPIEFTGKPIIYNSGERFHAKFYDEYGNVLKNKYVIFNIDNSSFSALTNNTGIAYIPNDLNIGDYCITIINPIVNENITTDLLIFTSIESENMLVDKNTDFEFNAVFFDNDANVLVNTPIIFKINNEEKIINTDSNGVAALNLNLNAGTYEIYSTNTITNENKVNKIFVVSKVDSIISVDNINDINYNEKAVVNINVNPSYLNGNVEIKVSDGCDYEVIFNKTANTKITQELTGLDAGDYVVEIKYTNNDGIVFNSIKTFKVFKINPTIEITAENIYVGEDAKITVKILNSDGNLRIAVNNISYYEELSDGLLVKNISNLAIGKYNVNVLFYGDDNYNSFDKNVTFNVYYNLDKEVIIPSLDCFSDGESVSIILPNDVSGKFTLSINGKNYNFEVNKGKVDINIPDLPNGNYNYNIIYSGDDKYSPFTRTGNLIVKKVLTTNIITSAVTTVYNGNKFLVITLKDSEGKAISGAKLSVNLNGIKTINTDGNGQAKLTTNGLAPKTYTATITFNGNDNYIKSTATVKVTVKKATPKITAKAKTFKKSVKTKKYSITLKNNQNKVMKNTKVTIKVNKKTYTAKTNKKGVATFKIKNLNKKGTFKATITYKGNSYYNKVTKKVNIKVK